MKILIFLSSLIYFSNTIHIQCSFSYINWGISWDPSVYSCNVQAIDFSGNATHLKSYGGTHLADHSNLDVRAVGFDLTFCRAFSMSIIPKGISTLFPNFHGLLVSSCPVNVLNGDELNGYHNLLWYTHNFSGLVRIPRNYFASTPIIRRIEFSRNQLRHVAYDLFDGLDLFQLSFISNPCINDFAPVATDIPRLIQVLRTQCPE